MGNISLDGIVKLACFTSLAALHVNSRVGEIDSDKALITLSHISAHRVALTAKIDELTRALKSDGNIVQFTVFHGNRALKQSNTFGGAYNYWFSQSNKEELSISAQTIPPKSYWVDVYDESF